jgi:hypothetical protein
MGPPAGCIPDDNWPPYPSAVHEHGQSTASHHAVGIISAYRLNGGRFQTMTIMHAGGQFPTVAVDLATGVWIGYEREGPASPRLLMGMADSGWARGSTSPGRRGSLQPPQPELVTRAVGLRGKRSGEADLQI